MKKFLLLVFSLLLINLTSVANTGWFQDYVKIDVNGAGTSAPTGWYWIGGNPSYATQLDGINFGTVNSLVITGCDMKYWSDNQDRTGGSFFYKIMSADNITQVVGPVETIWTQTFLGGNDYQGISAVSINILNNLSPNTTYKLHIWAKSWGSSQGDSYLSNGSLDYVATFTTAAAPIAYNVTGTGSYCAGGTGLAVGIDDSETGVTYTLYKGGVAQTPTVEGTGEAISFGLQTTGTYTVKGTRSVFITDMTGSAIITENPTSVGGTISGGTNVCSGTNSTVLTLADHVGSVIKWQYSTDAGTNWFDIVNTGTTYTAIDLTVTTQYQAIVKSGECASATSSVATLTVNPLPAAVTVNGAGTFCSTATITASNGGDGTIYFQGTTSGGTSTATASTSQVITTSGTYYFRALSAGGCWGTEGSAVVTINAAVTASVSIQASANPVVSGTSVTFTATPVNGGTPPTTYAWFINGNPSGFNQPTLTYNPFNNNTIYVVMTSSLPCTSPVQSNTITMTVTTAPANSTWDGSSDNDWHNADNWSDGVPGSTTNISIPFTGITNFPTISSAATCNNITLESGASILGNNHLTVKGTTSVNRFFAGNEWHLLSSPILNANTGMFIGKYLQYHNETNNKYYDILSADSAITVAKGYAIWGGSGFTSSFVGPLNDNNKSYPVKKAGQGWNLVGNPYPSYIDWNASGWTKTNVNATIYIHVNASTWATWNGTAGTGGGSRYIAPCQGFFVEASANGTLGMSNAVRTHETATYYKSSEDVVPNLIRLEISGNGFKDDAVIYFTPTATTEFDGESDARKLFGDVAEAPQIYSFGPTPLAINTLRELASVPVGIHAGTNGTFTIAATEINDLNYVTLEDTKTGIFTEMANKSYTFDFIAGENEQRFKLHFSSVGIDEKETITANIYSYQQTVYVNLADNSQGDIYIYNLAGQLITAQESASGNVRIGLNSLGVYMVKVVTEKETLTRKVVIR